MANVYFVTQAGRGYVSDDTLLVPELAALGHRPIELPWTSSLAKITADDVLVIRAIWDYHLRPREFSAWLDEVERIGCTVINPASLIRWNHRKNYLAEMASRGVRVPQTFFFGSPEHFAQSPPLLEGGREYVIKPVVSASAHATFRATAESVARIVREHPYEGLLVQEFIPEIAEGEWSVIFIGDEFTHAVKKIAKSGDFRVQRDFGGQALPDVPPQRAVDAARHIIALLPEQPTYARIDLVMRGDEPLLMEIELIEPDLFLAHAPAAARKFAELIAAAAK